MLTDSHCHLASHRFSPTEIPDLLARARSAGVTRMVTLATSLDDIAGKSIHRGGSRRARLHRHPSVRRPSRAGRCDHAARGVCKRPARLRHRRDRSRLLSPRARRLGRAGFPRTPARFLRQHFELAAASGLNVVIHTRDSRATRRSKTRSPSISDYHTSVRAVFHCFIGPWENANRVLDLGGRVSLRRSGHFQNRTSSPRDRMPVSGRILHGRNGRTLSRARTLSRKTQRTLLRPEHRGATRIAARGIRRGTRTAHDRARPAGFSASARNPD